jgi:hypothetical protein
MAIELRQSILATIAYADIFDYPLTGDEIRLWLILRKSGESDLLRTLSGLAGNRINLKRYYFLSGRRLAAGLRKLRANTSRDKLKQVAGLCFWYRLIPTINLVGITGGLASGNAGKADDIDLIFVVRSGTVWISRLATIFFTEMFARRRRAGDHDVADKICLNMFMTEGALTMPPAEQDLYLAHEVLQMKPVWSRGGIYLKFLTANRWTEKFLPAAYDEKYRVGVTLYNEEKHNLLWEFLKLIAYTSMRLLEPPARAIQLAYMKKRRTSEVVTDNLIRFHPQDSRAVVRMEFCKRLRRLNIPLTKIWTGV